MRRDAWVLAAAAAGAGAELPAGGGGVGGSSLLDCSGDAGWSSFRQRLQAAVAGGRLVLSPEVAETARALVVSALETQALLLGAEQFYQDLCAEGGARSGSFCLYGAVNALIVLAAGYHGGAYWKDGGPNTAQEYLSSARSLLGLQHCLDFMESSAWPLHANDILANLNASASVPFQLALREPEPSSAPPAPLGSTLHGWTSGDLAEALEVTVSCSREVRAVAIGTHPTLTLEAITMLRDYGLPASGWLQVRRTLGITYKCAIFPEMCVGRAASEDPVAELIGPFDSPPPYESYTLRRVAGELEKLAGDLRADGLDLLICTSPFVICGLLQKLTGAPMLGYLGLPLLWKRPTDHFDDPAARAEFWRLLEHLGSHSNVVLFTNNPMLSEQIRFQSDLALPVVRPHAVFAGATYAPTRMGEAIIISRTKFMWVTLGCALRQFLPEAYPIGFTVANSDSKLPFQEMASYRAAVLVPWEHALMAFFELYSMGVPLLMPDALWSYRLVFDAEGNLGSTTPQYTDVSPRCEQGPRGDDAGGGGAEALGGCSPGRHPFPPFGFASLAARRYWWHLSSFAQFPYVQAFASVPELLQRLPAFDAAGVSALMKEFNDLTFVRSVASWRRAARALLAGAETAWCAAEAGAPAGATAGAPGAP